MFRQLLTPVGDSLGLSFLVAALPIVAILVLLGVLRRPAWQAALTGRHLRLDGLPGPTDTPPRIEPPVPAQ